jgi:UDP-N-acetylmuramate dehydrogenase
VPGYFAKQANGVPDSRRVDFSVLNTSPDLKKDLRSIRENGEPEIHERVDLRAWTALGIGGLADLLIRCRSADGLQRALDVLATHGQRWLVLGAGSRLVPPDRGLRSPVLNLSGSLGLWELDLDGAVAGGGANLAQLSRAAARTGLSGTEGLIGAGSSVGGAVQAACKGHLQLAALLDWLEVARPGREIDRIQLPDRRGRRGPIDIDLSRRVVVRARLQLVGGGTPAEATKASFRNRHRGQRQPRSAQPLFADPAEGKAEAILTEAECVDLKVGGARISDRHPNRVTTSKTARAADVLELTRMARDRVLERRGITLEPAICFVDEDGGAFDL